MHHPESNTPKVSPTSHSTTQTAITPSYKIKLLYEGETRRVKYRRRINHFTYSPPQCFGSLAILVIPDKR